MRALSGIPNRVSTTLQPHPGLARHHAKSEYVRDGLVGWQRADEAPKVRGSIENAFLHRVAADKSFPGLSESCDIIGTNIDDFH